VCFASGGHRSAADAGAPLITAMLAILLRCVPTATKMQELCWRCWPPLLAIEPEPAQGRCRLRRARLAAR
jgi:hypothetical protein